MKLLMAHATAWLKQAEYQEAKRGGNWCDNVEHENREGRGGERDRWWSFESQWTL